MQQAVHYIAGVCVSYHCNHSDCTLVHLTIKSNQVHL